MIEEGSLSTVWLILWPKQRSTKEIGRESAGWLNAGWMFNFFNFEGRELLVWVKLPIIWSSSKVGGRESTEWLKFSLTSLNVSKKEEDCEVVD